MKENHQTTKGKTKEKEMNREKIQNQLENKFKMEINTYLSKISLNVNGLNAPINRQRVADWIKTRACNMLPTRDLL